MPTFIVRHAYFVEADSKEQAAAVVAPPQIVQQPTFTRVHEPVPASRLYGPMKWYTQPHEVLDNAWDAFHEREIADAPFPGEPDLFPHFVDLSLKGVEPPQISMVMDVAITSYVERVERLGR